MIFSWLRRRRRRKLLAAPFPVRFAAIIERNVGHAALLPEPLRARLRDATTVLLAEKEWLGRGGLFVNEEMRVTIAAQAALLLLGREDGYFDSVREVVVFPTTFRTPRPEDGWEDDFLSDTISSGQAVYTGTVLLAWDEVLHEGRDPAGGYNVVLHEFAHQLDFAEGLAGGAPRLGDRELEARWKYVMSVAFADHRRAVKANEPELFFTPHAADDELEFFADLTEAFFCRPHDLRNLYPELYRLIAAYYRLDPVAWAWSA
ncbi:zinc-dependent peptidase [Gemmata sp. JC717]|uniref:M90 family metallopeptidase n=1 Tax=Gemmata algarum TaxID=2975278 RepID=UPI0021BB7273|nr:zinc-dependent peptidase [Gemmata algarum]MDY3555249.1 zinc-dependent peptidase [Gemmata algarum]